MAEEIKKEEPLIAVVERMEKANAEMRELLNKQAEITAKNLLSGNTNAGVQPEVKKEETPAEYAKRVSMGRI
jgi:hypothetical protein